LYSAKGCKKLERDKWTSLRENKMEELQEGHMFHIGTK
jgi:hypothetical protein